MTECPGLQAITRLEDVIDELCNMACEHELYSTFRLEREAVDLLITIAGIIQNLRGTLETIHTEMSAWAPDNSMSSSEYSDAQQIMEWRNRIGDAING